MSKEEEQRLVFISDTAQQMKDFLAHTAQDLRLTKREFILILAIVSAQLCEAVYTQMKATDHSITLLEVKDVFFNCVEAYLNNKDKKNEQESNIRERKAVLGKEHIN